VKTTVYITITLLKVAIIVTGMMYVISNFISWKRTKEGKKLKKAAIIFGGIFLSILILSAVEIVITFN